MTLLDDLTGLVADWHAAVPALTEKERGRGWTLDACADELAQLIARHSSPLSEVQAHTLTLVAGGHSFQQIADLYKAPYPTVNWRVQRIHKLYGTRSSTVAVIAALRAGHITLDDIDTKWEGSEATTREVQAMQAVADHGTNHAAARATGLTETAVKGYLQRASDKAHASNRVDLVVRAYREGLVT